MTIYFRLIVEKMKRSTNKKYEEKRKHNKKKDLFTSIKLQQCTNQRNLHPKGDSTGEVYFPKLEQQESSIDTLWMVGFLHHEEGAKEKKV